MIHPCWLIWLQLTFHHHIVLTMWTYPQLTALFYCWGSSGDLGGFAITNNATIYILVLVPWCTQQEFLQGMYLREESWAGGCTCSTRLSNAKLFSKVVAYFWLFSCQIRGMLVLLITSKAFNQQKGKLFLFAASPLQINSTPKQWPRQLEHISHRTSVQTSE